MPHPIEKLPAPALDLMFELCSRFQGNKEHKKIAIALDAAFALGAVRNHQITGLPMGQIVVMQQKKFDDLGIKRKITEHNLTGLTHS